MQANLDLDEGDRNQKFSQHFDFRSVLGNGAFGLVVAATDKKTGALHAVKVKGQFNLQKCLQFSSSILLS